MRVQIDRVVAYHGSIITLGGTLDDGRAVMVDCDCRPAREILDALETEPSVSAEAEEWQVRVIG